MFVLIIVLAVITALATTLYIYASMRQAKHNKHMITGIDQVNDAVNHTTFGMPTLVQRVADQDERSIALAAELADFREWTQQALHDIAAHQGLSLVKAPEPVIPNADTLPPYDDHPH